MISGILKVGESMKKINSLKKSTDFERIIKKNRSYKYRDYFIYVEYNTEDIYHFGLSVGKKIGNAVIRNRVKRQLRSMLDKEHYENNFNCIIIVRKNYLDNDYETNEKELLDALKQLKLVKGQNSNENKK